MIQEHFEYLSILSYFNIITSLTYMHYKIFPSCQTIIDIGTTCTYMQQNSSPRPSKQAIGVYSVVFNSQKLYPFVFADQGIKVNTVTKSKKVTIVETHPLQSPPLISKV